ncbi:hypothetical protein D9756_001127 [Leucocoprinus leucothites]|uniref:Major facilitator superfamily (MFS) profile domain-containing protein n=1 Tax=Leucocoprinus leucothites TaxID=201217 RepID=A0A8H5GF39_9AGAR|nr:hypothetical protein D9756_001127 [Leucoagaricus leucothites]
MSRIDEPLHDIDLNERAVGHTRIHLEAASQETTTIQHITVSGSETQIDKEDKDKEEATPTADDDSTKTIYVDFEPNDPRNPIYFPRRKKWAITLLACFSTLVASSTASGYNLGFGSMTRDLNATEFQATEGLSMYALGFGVVPLVTASFSEEFGRQPLYLWSGIGFLLMYIMVGLAQNIQTVVVGRFLQGAFGSTAATMVGGTIADIWSPAERGLPMSIFSIVALAGNGFGPLIAGWIELNPRLEWRWIQWIQLIYAGTYVILIPFILHETRSTIVIKKIAHRLRKKTGDKRYRARVEDEGVNLKKLIWISCTRPVYLMLTEPIVASFSLWFGFAWGVNYCMIESISMVFTTLHDFNSGQVGLAFLSMIVAPLLGFCTNFYQEYLYKKYFPTKGPEARLYLAMAAGVILPGAMFIYAWTSFPHIHWIAPIIGITTFIWGIFMIYTAVFSYLADCYGPFASSALAGQSLARNITALSFPLFTQQMYHRLGIPWANTLFAFIALLLLPIPYVLFIWGPQIRRRSKFSRVVMEADEAKAAEEAKRAQEQSNSAEV